MGNKLIQNNFTHLGDKQTTLEKKVILIYVDVPIYEENTSAIVMYGNRTIGEINTSFKCTLHLIDILNPKKELINFYEL